MRLQSEDAIKDSRGALTIVDPGANSSVQPANVSNDRGAHEESFVLMKLLRETSARDSGY